MNAWAARAWRLLASPVAPRIALGASLVLAWANAVTTARWSHVPGSVHGPKRLFFFFSLLLLTFVALRRRPPAPERLDGVARVVLIGGVALLLAAFFTWFPPGTWRLIPFLDDWPPRYQSTVEGVALLGDGRFTGWQWAFLGGYHLSSDVTQSLTLLAAIPMALTGGLFGFHLLHLLLFAALPALVYVDCRIGRLDRTTTWLATGLVAVIAVNYSYFLIRSGDTNSLAGVVTCTATLVAAHAARVGSRWGAAGLAVSLTLTNYAHRGFFVYALIFLAVDALVSRDRRSAARAAIATGTAWAAGLPLTWESWRYPSYFIYNNVQLATGQPLDWAALARSVYYNIEILAMPWRWFNDYTGLTNLLLPVTAFVAVGHRDRVRFHAWFLLAAMALVRLNDAQFGYSFLRPVHMYVVFSAVVLAGFAVRWLPTRVGIASVALFVGLYVQMAWIGVPHLASIEEFDRPLVQRIRTLDGHLIALENNFHADVDLDPVRRSELSRFGVHYEALLPAATSRFFYAGIWDGWQWSPYRHQVFANGTFQGRRIDTVPTPDLVAELRRWGVRHLLVWSEPMRASLSRRPEFEARWRSDRWTDFELLGADTRGVVSVNGRGELLRQRPTGGRVELAGVAVSDEVILRMNYHPSWRAELEGNDVPLENRDGQVLLRAPRAGAQRIELIYPARRWLLVVAGISLISGCLLASSLPPIGRRE